MIRLLCGENTFAIDAEVAKLKQQFLSEHDAFGLERLDGEDFDKQKFGEALLQLPFLVSKKLVLIRHVYASKESVAYIEQTLDSIPSEVDVLLVDPKADKRTRLYKTLLSSGSVNEHRALKTAGLVRWASAYAQEFGAELSDVNAEKLIRRVGEDQALLASEIQKLSPLMTIDATSIELLTEQGLQQSVFDLLEYIFTGNSSKALQLFDDLHRAGTDVNEVMGLVAWQLHVLLLVKYAKASKDSEIMAETGLSPYVVSKASRVVRTMSTYTLNKVLQTVLETDFAIKTGKAEANGALKVLILELAALTK